ncbi:MAG: Hsp20/alpha crystallin family protein [Bdellovibrionota bacterium]
MKRSKNMPSVRSDNQFWSPFQELMRLQSDIDRLSEDFMGPSTGMDIFRMPNAFVPAVDVQEADDHFLLSMDMPGIRKEDVKIEVQDNTLSVTGERHDECEEKGKNHYHAERFYGTFQRSLSLPGNIKADQIESSFEDGVLRIALPKMEVAKSKSIPIGEKKGGLLEKFLRRRSEGDMKKSA